MRNFLHIWLVMWLVLGPLALLAEELPLSADFSDSRLPWYDEKGHLSFILYGRNGKTVGVTIVLEHVLLDLIKRNVNDIDMVKDFSAIQPYPLTTPRTIVLNFWEKYPHSDGIIATPAAIFDRAAMNIKSSEKVMFRSAMLDIDGVGFDADLATKTIHIRRNVQVVVRYDMVPKPEHGADAAPVLTTKRQTAEKATNNNEKYHEQE